MAIAKTPRRQSPNRARSLDKGPKPRPAARLPLVPIAIGLVVALGIVAVIASRVGREESESESVGPGIEQTRPVTVSGKPLAPSIGEADPALGADMPELRGASFDGTEVAITNDGTSKIIMFLAHWCPHCQREVPTIMKWLKENGDPQGVRLYSVATGTVANRPNYPPSVWLEREGWTVPVLADDTATNAAQAFGLNVFPFFVAVDANGKVVARASGELTINQLEELVASARG